MSDSNKSYRQIMKATSIFGGVQVFQIVIGIIRSKFVAVLLGPAGMGITGLLISTTTMISSMTNFGLGTSAVKNIAAAHATNDQNKLGVVVSTFRKLVWITGVLGFIITLFLSPYLSQLAFGNRNYTWSFAILSITLLVGQISTGQNVLLRGTRKIKYLAQSSMIGGVVGLIVTIPLYYFYNTDGIVPAILIASFTSLLLTWYFASKVEIKKIELSWKQVFFEGKEMLQMGFMISLSGIIMLATSYVVRLYISNYGSIADLGLYNAGFTIIGTYVSMIFAAIAADFYPRLSAIAHDREAANNVVNQQSEIAMLILAPIILIFIVFIKWVIFILYSTSFMPIRDMLLYAAIGMLFKALSWPIAHLFLAKGTNKLFFWNELIYNVYTLLFNILGYYYYGLTGMGVSFLLTYFLYLFQVYFITKVKFKFELSVSIIRISSLQMFLAITCFFTSFYSSYPYVYGIILCFISLIYSIIHLDKKMNLKLRDKFKKN